MTAEASILHVLERLRSLTSSDFIAWAPVTGQLKSIRWKYALGSRNDRIQHMRIKKGYGLAGAAVKLERMITLDDTHSDADWLRQHCPVMLAEHLHTAAAIPVKHSAVLTGLLYIGKRTPPGYREEELNEVSSMLHSMMGETDQ